MSEEINIIEITLYGYTFEAIQEPHLDNCWHAEMKTNRLF